jgi:uncharacterized protein YndB with AHSA1/START domain
MNTDRIEKKVLLHALRKRVWRALSDSKEFGYWFGVTIDGPFTPGASIHGVISGTAVDAEVAAAQRTHQGKPFDIIIEQMEPEKIFSFRWHPHAIDTGVDYSAEPTTLVVFALEEVADGVMLTVTESGFDQLPLERRATAFAGNDGGWTLMVQVFAKYVNDTQ